MGFVDSDTTEDFGPSNKGRSLPPEDYRVNDWLTGIVREGKEVQRTTMAAEGQKPLPQFWRPNGSYITDETGRKRYWTTDAKDPDTGKPNRPMNQWRVEVDTEYRNPEIPHDDGVRFFYVSGGRKNPVTAEAVLVQAMVAAGVSDFNPGDKIAMRKTSAKRNTQHTWEARYEKGAAGYVVKPRIDAEGNPWVPGDEPGGFVGGGSGSGTSDPVPGVDPWATGKTVQSDAPPFFL